MSVERLKKYLNTVDEELQQVIDRILQIEEEKIALDKPHGIQKDIDETIEEVARLKLGKCNAT